MKWFLEIGSGTGYTAALLAHHAQRVETVEIRPEFVSLARNNLSEVGIVNVNVHQGDAARGWGTDVEYDCILFSGSVSEIPVQYKNSLVVGGPVGSNRWQGPNYERSSREENRSDNMGNDLSVRDLAARRWTISKPSRIRLLINAHGDKIIVSNSSVGD